MAIGPVQLLVLGFEHPDFHGEVIEELEKLRASDTVKVIDALAVYKDATGQMEVMHLSNLTKDEAIELGSKVAALIGLGIDGEEGMVAGAEIGAEMAAEEGIHVFSDEEAWDVLEDIPNDSAAALSSSTTGLFRCATRSCGPAASASATASSIPSISSRSGSSPQPRPRSTRRCIRARCPPRSSAGQRRKQALNHGGHER